MAIECIKSAEDQTTEWVVTKPLDIDEEGSEYGVMAVMVGIFLNLIYKN